LHKEHRPLSKDKNLSKKKVFDNFGKLPTKTTARCQKGFLEEKA
jgi:hypothetical protein